MIAGPPFKQQSGKKTAKTVAVIFNFICKKYNHNQLQTEDITLILGMGITRRKPVALTRNLVTLWRRRTSAPTPPPLTPWPRPSLVFKLEKIPDCPARCSLFKYQPLDIQCTVLGISHKYWQHSAGHLTDSLSTFIYTLHMSSRASNEGYPKGPGEGPY